MKKKVKKIAIGSLSLLCGAFILSGCTQSFCSTNDKAHMLYAYDYGITDYIGADEISEYQAEHANADVLTLPGFTDIYYSINYCEGLTNVITTAKNENSLDVPSEKFWFTIDTIVLKNALDKNSVSYANATIDDIRSSLDKYGYLKYAGTEDDSSLWTNFSLICKEARDEIGSDYCPNDDFVSYYKKTLNNAISAYRSCLALNDGDYGYYGFGGSKKPIKIEGKSYGYAWSKGFLEGLLVYPIGALIDVLVQGFSGINNNQTTGLEAIQNGWPQLLAILLVTVIVRGLMLLATFKQTAANSKMQALQPEIAKIQAKYPNANTNTYEKQRLAEETSKLYKKNKINPLGTLLVLVIQFPVFICVWGAFQGSAYLSSGSFLGLKLSDTISSVLFVGTNWTAEGNFSAITALILFLLMAGAQTVSMLLPQRIQKKKAKKIAKMGKNPAQAAQESKTKTFTYVMLIMIIVMGFSLASAMGVYWFVGALFSIAQTLITELVTSNKKGKK